MNEQQQRELQFILDTMPDEPMEWYFFSDAGERHTTHTTHEFFKFAHTHRAWGYTNAKPKES